MLLLNLKTYSESTGLNCKKLLDTASEFLESQNEIVKQKVIFVVSPTDLFWAKQNYPNLIIASQHVENKTSGSTTGWITPEALLSMGVNFSLYNHSEHRMYSDTIIQDIKDIQSKGLKLIVCCENLHEGLYLQEAEPFSIAYEPKDLIGSGISVTTRPEAVTDFIAALSNQKNILIGAGVSTAEDIKKTLELGAEGVLLASAFVKADDRRAKLNELVQPFA